MICYLYTHSNHK